jgi:hypothetical protein
VRPYLEKKKKNPSLKSAGGMAQGVGHEFKPSTAKNNNNKRLLFTNV